jgi:hypothetical protein
MGIVSVWFRRNTMQPDDHITQHFQHEGIAKIENLLRPFTDGFPR